MHLDRLIDVDPNDQRAAFPGAPHSWSDRGAAPPPRLPGAVLRGHPARSHLQLEGGLRPGGCCLPKDKFVKVAIKIFLLLD